MTDVPTTAPADVGALAEQVRRVATLRAALRTNLDSLARRREDFERDNGILLGLIESVGAEVDAAETVVRTLALAQYDASGSLNPTPGVAVKLYETLHYEADAALAWAREKQMALVPESLNRKAFEKIAKATPLPFVSVVTEPKAQIATDLDKALGGAA